jgi:hypothetical protein
MNGYGVSVGVCKHEGPPKWTIERPRDDPNPGLDESIVEGLGVIGFEPQGDAPAESLASLQVDGGLANGKGYWSGGKDDRPRWALGGPLKAKLLRIERGRRLEVADLQ